MIQMSLVAPLKAVRFKSVDLGDRALRFEKFQMLDRRDDLDSAVRPHISF